MFRIGSQKALSAHLKRHGDLAFAHVEGPRFDGDLSGACFIGCDMAATQFVDCTLDGATLEDCDLDASSLSPHQ